MTRPKSRTTPAAAVEAAEDVFDTPPQQTGSAKPFDALDTLLSDCALLVGNDSGPKHLAALRGTKVVTLFTNRISFAEWGQEQTGVIITRKVPCAGCQILHDTDECAKDFVCITGIRPEEVFDTVLRLL